MHPCCYVVVVVIVAVVITMTTISNLSEKVVGWQLQRPVSLHVRLHPEVLHGTAGRRGTWGGGKGSACVYIQAVVCSEVRPCTFVY